MKKDYLSAGFYLLLGLLTLVPFEITSVNMLGYFSICSFAPVSTGILFGIAGFKFFMIKKIKEA